MSWEYEWTTSVLIHLTTFCQGMLQEESAAEGEVMSSSFTKPIIFTTIQESRERLITSYAISRKTWRTGQPCACIVFVVLCRTTAIRPSAPFSLDVGRSPWLNSNAETIPAETTQSMPWGAEAHTITVVYTVQSSIVSSSSCRYYDRCRRRRRWRC